jgi:hypothetical protein
MSFNIGKQQIPTASFAAEATDAEGYADLSAEAKDLYDAAVTAAEGLIEAWPVDTGTGFVNLNIGGHTATASAENEPAYGTWVTVSVSDATAPGEAAVVEDSTEPGAGEDGALNAPPETPQQ